MLWLAACVVTTEITAGARNNGGEAAGKDQGKKGNRAAAMVIFCDGVSAPVPFLRLAGPVRICTLVFVAVAAPVTGGGGGG